MLKDKVIEDIKDKATIAMITAIPGAKVTHAVGRVIFTAISESSSKVAAAAIDHGVSRAADATASQVTSNYNKKDTNIFYLLEKGNLKT